MGIKRTMELMESIGNKPNNFLKEVYGRAIANNQNLVVLNEMTMERLLGKHFNKGLCIVSASRVKENTAEENNKYTREMYQAIIDSPYSFIPVFGGFIETTDNGEKLPAKYEKSAIILNYDKKGNEMDFDEMKAFAMSLGTKYKQDSILVKAPNDNPKYILTSNNIGEVDYEFSGDVKINDLTQEYFTSFIKSLNMSPNQDERRKTRFSFTEMYINPTFTTLNEGHSRKLKGEIVIKD